MEDKFYINEDSGTYVAYELGNKHAKLVYLVIGNKDASNPLTVDVKCDLNGTTDNIMSVVIPANDSKELNPGFDLTGDVKITLSRSGVVAGRLKIITS